MIVEFRKWNIFDIFYSEIIEENSLCQDQVKSLSAG